MSDYFNSKYPILCVGMNQISDINLAIAVKKAGAIPCLSAFNYFKNENEIDSYLINQNVKMYDTRWGKFVPYLLLKDIMQYKSKFKELDLFISLNTEALMITEIQEMLIEHKVRFIEFVHTKFTTMDDEKYAINFLNKLKDNGTKIFVKTLSLSNHNLYDFDGLILKGPQGAGTIVDTGLSINELFLKARKLYPNLKLIVSGGVSTNTEIKYYLDNGAVAVGIGTLFAVSSESSMSLETKIKMINLTSDNIQNLKKMFTQNLIQFSKLENVLTSDALKKGLDNPNEGLVFIGHGINQITKILTVHEIIQALVKDL
jgi:NAD(P)H-dependent flavin oxidoreductase YrpB (nitropropane dioxygenase family)